METPSCPVVEIHSFSGIHTAEGIVVDPSCTKRVQAVVGHGATKGEPLKFHDSLSDHPLGKVTPHLLMKVNGESFVARHDTLNFILSQVRDTLEAAQHASDVVEREMKNALNEINKLFSGNPEFHSFQFHGTTPDSAPAE